MADFSEVPTQLAMRLSIVLNRDLIRKSPIFKSLTNRYVVRYVRVRMAMPGISGTYA